MYTKETFRGAGITRHQTNFDHADIVRSPETFYGYPLFPYDVFIPPSPRFQLTGQTSPYCS